MGPRLSGVVVIVSANGTEDRGLESRQGARFLTNLNQWVSPFSCLLVHTVKIKHYANNFAQENSLVKLY
jgi:hypothetical protein